MKKKLVAQGPASRQSFTVTLPKEWVVDQGLDKAREVDLSVVGRRVVVASWKRKESSVTIRTVDYKNSLRQVLPSLYRRGVVEIRCIVGMDKHFGEITALVRDRLIGCEIVSHKGDVMTIRYIAQESDEDFHIILRRIFLLLLELSSLSTSAEQRNVIDVNISRFVNYAQRVLVVRGHTEFDKITFFYLLLDQLEKLHDEFVWLHAVATRKHDTAIRELSGLLRKAYDVFYSFSAKDFNASSYRAYKLKNELVLDAHISRTEVHLHNISRLINSLFATIYALVGK